MFKVSYFFRKINKPYSSFMTFIKQGFYNPKPKALKRITVLSLIFCLSSCVNWTNRPNFAWPVNPPYNLSRKYSIYHEGIDFPKTTGQAVLATAEGTVIYAGAQFSGYGKVIIIEHDYNWASLYAHLSKISIKNGHSVKRQQKIGEVGNTGRSSSAHLHFELIRKKQPVNPVPYLPNP